MFVRYGKKSGAICLKKRWEKTERVTGGYKGYRGETKKGRKCVPRSVLYAVCKTKEQRSFG